MTLTDFTRATQDFATDDLYFCLREEGSIIYLVAYVTRCALMPAFVLASRRLAMRYPPCIAQRARYGDLAAGTLQMLIVCCDLRVRRSGFVRFRMDIFIIFIVEKRLLLRRHGYFSEYSLRVRHHYMRRRVSRARACALGAYFCACRSVRVRPVWRGESAAGALSVGRIVGLEP